MATDMTAVCVRGGDTAAAHPIDPGRPFRPRFKHRCYRKVAGFRLGCLTFLFLLTLPITIIGLLFKLLGTLLVKPTQVLFTSIVMPEFVRLAYIHRLGAIHPKLSRGLFKLKRPHSRPIRIDVRSAKRQNVSVHTLAQLSDNLGYLIVNRTDPHSLRACIVDCGDAESCRQIIAGIANVHYGNQLIHIEAILTTHHHWDHMGGNEKMGVSRIYAGRYDRVKGATYFLDDLERFEVAGLEFEALHTPCHTRGSIVFRLLGEDGHDCLFLGDTLFCGGCGAFFEGTQLDMHKAFARLVLTCNSDSLLFPGHEYTEQILMDHFPIKAAQYAARDPSRFFRLCGALCRAHHLRSLPFPAPTVPIRLSEEVAYNATFDPVMRCCLLLKECLFSLRPNQQPSDPTPGLLVSTPSTPDAARPDQNIAEPDRLRPKVAMDELGQIVVVEPPWILDHSLTASPFITTWRDELLTPTTHSLAQRLLYQPHCLTGDQLKTKDEERRIIRKSALFKGWPTCHQDVIDVLKVLTDNSNTHIPYRTLELAVTQTLDQQLPPATPQDLEKLSRLFRVYPKTHQQTSASTEQDSSPHFGRRRSVRAMARVPLSELVSFVSQQLMAFEEEAEMNRPRRSATGLRLDESIQVHDFTACRICQCQAVRGGTRQLELARTGTTYSSRRHGLTTIITAADSDLSRALSGGKESSSRRADAMMRRIASFPASENVPTPSNNALQLPPHSANSYLDQRRLLMADSSGSPTPASARDDFFLAHRLVEGKSLLMFSGDFEVFDAQRERLSPGYLTMATLSSVAD